MYNVSRKNNYGPFFDLFDFPFSEDENSHALMKTDIEENDSSYVLNIEVPSVKKDEIKIKLDDGYLSVSVNQNHENVEKDKNSKVIHRERFVGNYRRSFYVGDNVRYEDISAALEDGVLKVDVKKRAKEEKNSSQFIEIK